MTTTHYSENVVRDQAKQAAKKKTRKYVVLGAVAAVAVIPTAAYAAMTLFGTGNAEVFAYQAQNMPVTNTAFSKTLYPGASANLTFRVDNPNPFPVNITKIAATGADTFNGGGCPNGANLSGPVMGLNQDYPLPTAVEVGAGGYANVTVPNAVTLGSNATNGCGFKIAVKITGAQKVN